MKYALTLIIACCSVLSSKADYQYVKLSELLAHSDYAAIGTIVKLDENYFYLKVTKYVLGELDFDTLQIQKFTNWACGKRFYDYEIGQSELVFFRKSNYVIADYELLGYGVGGEFELPIKNDSVFYNYQYGKLEPYSLTAFVAVLKDYEQLKGQSKNSTSQFSEEEKSKFISKSELHKLFLEPKIEPWFLEEKAASNGYLANSETNFLYQDYDNKIYAFGYNLDSIVLVVNDAEVRKQDNFFVVNPKKGWTRRFLNVYDIKDTSKTEILFNQIFEVIELPEPRIYFGWDFSDTIESVLDGIPMVAHYLDELHRAENLNYELLTYTLTIKCASGEESEFKIKSSSGTPEVKRRLRKLENGDQIAISNVLVLYPNNSVRTLHGRTVTYYRISE